jgi:hypothetical protein
MVFKFRYGECGRKGGAMASYTGNIKGERIPDLTGGTVFWRLVKQLVKRFWRAMSIDEDAFFKSREWPYLWSK